MKFNFLFSYDAKGVEVSMEKFTDFNKFLLKSMEVINSSIKKNIHALNLN